MLCGGLRFVPVSHIGELVQLLATLLLLQLPLSVPLQRVEDRLLLGIDFLASAFALAQT